MRNIKVEVKEQKGPLGFGTSYHAEISESGTFGFSVNQASANNTTPERALEDAMERFIDNREKGK